jgi:hypothetical protein
MVLAIRYLDTIISLIIAIIFVALGVLLKHYFEERYPEKLSLTLLDGEKILLEIIKTCKK